MRPAVAIFLFLLVVVFLLPASSGAEHASESVRIFQTAAFRGSFKALPKWKRVLSMAQKQVKTLSVCNFRTACPPGAASWLRIKRDAEGKDRVTQLKMVNAFFNSWPYRLDVEAYGASDWWATPQEFLRLSGDCEDYAIIKYFMLRELGFAASDLRIVILKDRIRNIGHAILVVFLQGDALVLDNVTSAIFSHRKYKHYVPQFSVNEKYRWSHIALAKQP